MFLCFLVLCGRLLSFSRFVHGVGGTMQVGAGQGAHRPDVESYPTWDTKSDTWSATDALGRVLPGFREVGPPRANRYVGVFYFLWHGSFSTGGPFDNTKILAADPDALAKPTSPLWGPWTAPHHWGEPLFGYYLTDDDYVLRKHAQMLSDAGVDVIIFDVTNQVTYKSQYMELLRVFSEVRREGGKTPQVAFLCPFGEPANVVRELYRDLYGAGISPDLWFKWKGKPLILADPDRLGERNPDDQQKNPVELTPSSSLGQTFVAKNAFDAVSVNITTYGGREAAFTLSIYANGANGRHERGSPVARQRFSGVSEYSWPRLALARPLPAGSYRIEMTDPKGRVGWFTDLGPPHFKGQAFVADSMAPGLRSMELETRVGADIRLQDFFTFRAPQPDYFIGPTKPNMWSWLEAYPQHVFRDDRGLKEQMSVGVAQNAVDGRLGAMSEPTAYGRSRHNGIQDRRDRAVEFGFNFAEQFDRALQEDPEFIFITGWNEWIAGRFDAFPRVKQPVIFVDEFDEEHSRDIEPMKGGHGDDYYYQMVSYIRRYKGVRPPEVAGPAKTIDINGSFAQWAAVRPEYRDDIDDPALRDHPGWNHLHYANHSGRNDFVSLKVSRDGDYVYFYARTNGPISPVSDPSWMMLFIKTSDRIHPDWQGYQYVINRLSPDAQGGLLEESLGGWKWKSVARVRFRVQGNELQISIPRVSLGLSDQPHPLEFEFKWMDNMTSPGNIDDFTTDGDAAPNGRFNYRYSAR